MPTFLIGIVETKDLVDKVKETVEPVLSGLSLELVEVEFRREPVGMVLRVFIDKPGGVNLEDCARASGLIGDALDDADIIEVEYSLEVSSPGVERPLTRPAHYKRFVGHEMVVKTKERVEGRKRFKGTLMRADDLGFAVETADGDVFKFDYDKVLKAHLVFTDW